MKNSHRPKKTRPATPPKNLKPWLVAGAVLIALACLGIGPRLGRQQKLEAETSALRHEVPVVSAVRLKKASSLDAVALPSSLKAIEETTINARTSGYLQERFVDIGSRVTQGQILAIVESPEIDQQVSQTIAQVAKSRAGFGQAEADSAKVKATISTALADETRGEAGLLQAKADLAHVKASELKSEAAASAARVREVQANKRYAVSKAELKRANSLLDIAQKTLTRWKELYAGNAVSGQDVDEKQADFNSASATVEAANENVSTAFAEIDNAKQGVKSADADVVAAKADVASAIQRVRSASSAVEADKSNIQAARAAYMASTSNAQAAVASIRSDEASARRASAMQSFERVVAPFSGVITARNVDKGDLINPPSGSGASDPMMTVTKTGLFGLARTDVLRAVVSVPEDSVSAIRQGQSATVTVREYPNRTFQGAVFHLSGALDAATRTLLVEVRIPNKDGALKPGMYGQVKFLSSGGIATLRIPGDSLIFDAKGTRVALVTSAGTVHFQTVRLGRDFGDTIEVLEGLTGDEQVITNPDEALKEGENVKVLSQ